MSLAPDDPRHGTTNGYTNLRCRCQPCRDAWSVEQQRNQERRAAKLAGDPSIVPHGRASTYGNWKCRCRLCTEAYTAACNATPSKMKNRSRGSQSATM